MILHFSEGRKDGRISLKLQAIILTNHLLAGRILQLFDDDDYEALQ